MDVEIFIDKLDIVTCEGGLLEAVSKKLEIPKDKFRITASYELEERPAYRVHVRIGEKNDVIKA